MKLLRTSAYLNGRDSIHLSDCLLMSHCLWNDVEQMDAVNEMVQEAIRQCAEGYLLNTKDLKDELGELREKLSSENSLRETFDPGIQLVDTYYYQIEGVRMRERLLIFASDYQQLDETGKLFVLNKEKYKANCCTLKKFDPMLHSKANPKQIYTLKKGVRSIQINGFEYKLLCHEQAAPPPPPVEEDLEARMVEIKEKLIRAEESWEQLLGKEIKLLDTHLFLHEREKQQLRRIFESQKNNILRYKTDFNELKDAFQREKQEYQVEGPENDLFS